ncbi:DUF2063 domain-containing protein [Thalassococcus profundi]|uniref:DUF2063 domain-containing protein n=1 Tax=Thalassococcus profundi TaxID=2282382 RepID=A0A369TNJ3_9RHOB|nr:DNA-binding domain-containing protein [Thalassococcus profundi]RDD64516.1 DUF2063 domain-containing protein [Thalassococcus profundi]
MTVQSAFRAALLDADRDVPSGLTDGAGRPAGRRFAVYRNNVAVSLREALETGFPVVAKLLGPENFHMVAGVHLRAAPPRSPLMMQFGADFPAFLDSFPPLARLPYLGDVARIELALRRAYNAADAAPVDPARLSRLGEDRLHTARLSLAPAVSVICSPWPIFAIWARNRRPGSPKPIPGAQDVVILRPAFDPEPHLLPPGGGAFVAALLTGAPLARSIDAAGNGFDLSAALSLLLAQGAITDIQP